MGQSIAQKTRFSDFSRDCGTHVETTHEEYLKVFITVPNFLEIAVFVLCLNTVCIWLENAYSRLKIGFWIFYPINGAQYQRTTKGTTLHGNTLYHVQISKSASQCSYTGTEMTVCKFGQISISPNFP